MLLSYKVFEIIKIEFSTSKKIVIKFTLYDKSKLVKH